MRERGRFLTGLALSLISLAGCPSRAPKSCSYAGSQAAPISGTPIALVPGGTFAPVADGGALYISSAPQGGHVIYAGAFAANLDPCGVTLSGELLIADGGSALSNLDSRQSDFSVFESGIFYGPADLFSAMPNIPVCDGAAAGYLGRSILQITITDANGKSAVIKNPVDVSCLPGDDFCASACGPLH